jgi:Tat protein translocase TatB subunit
MFGIGMYEMIVILVVALIFVGPKKLPDIAKALGRTFNEFKKATNDFKETMGIDNELQDVKDAFDEMNKDIKETLDVTPSLKNEVLGTSDSSNLKNDSPNETTDKLTDAD